MSLGAWLLNVAWVVSTNWRQSGGAVKASLSFVVELAIKSVFFTVKATKPTQASMRAVIVELGISKTNLIEINEYFKAIKILLPIVL